MEGSSLLDNDAGSEPTSGLSAPDSSNPFDDLIDLTNGEAAASDKGGGQPPAHGSPATPPHGAQGGAPKKAGGDGFDEIEIVDESGGAVTAHVDSDWKRTDSSSHENSPSRQSDGTFGEPLETDGVLLVSLALVARVIEGPQEGAADPLPGETRTKVDRVGASTVVDAVMELDGGGEGTAAADDVWTVLRDPPLLFPPQAIEDIIRAATDAEQAGPKKGGKAKKALGGMLRMAMGGAAAVKAKVSQPDALLGSRRLKKMSQVATDAGKCKEGKVLLGSRRLGEMRAILGNPQFDPQ